MFLLTIYYRQKSKLRVKQKLWFLPWFDVGGLLESIHLPMSKTYDKIQVLYKSMVDMIYHVRIVDLVG